MFSLCRVALLLVLLGGVHHCQAQDIRPAVILKPEVTVSTENITLADIADFQGLDLQRQTRLASLDIVEVPRVETDVTVTRELVRLRLALEDGIDNPITIHGTACEVTRRDPLQLSDVGIQQELQRRLARQHRLTDDEIRLELMTPQISRWPIANRDGPHWHLEADFPPSPILGRVCIPVHLYDGERLVLSRHLQGRVSNKREVLVIARTVPRGRSLTESDLRTESRWLDDVKESVEAADVIGHPAVRTLPIGTIVQSHDLGEFEPARPEIVIQPRDAVRVIARKGSLHVTIPAAEALQSGRMGQIIRVKNLQSKRIIHGRVTAAGEVTVDIP